MGLPGHGEGSGRRRRSPTRAFRTARFSRPSPATSTARAPAANAPCTGSGLTGIPIYNVNNNCSTGSTALFLAKQLVEGGIAECVLAVGFEKMEKGSLGAKYMDRINPMDKHMLLMMSLREFAPAPPAPQMFGNAGREHMEKYGTTGRALRQDRLEEPQALGEQPLFAVPGRVLARRHHEREGGLRTAHQAAVLPDLGRRRRGHPRERRLREEARPPEERRRNRGHGHGHRSCRAPSTTRAASRSWAGT